MMKLIVGLGNPGEKYYSTRHNLGFLLLDQYVNQNNLGTFLLEKKFFGLYLKTNIEGEQTVFLKPQTYMNLSGRSVKSICSFFKIVPDDVLVIHDEIDLPTGTIKYKEGGGHAGHNGLKDIIKEFGTNTFKRIRVGIGRGSHPGQSVSDHVLGKLSEKERNIIQDDYLSVESIINNFITVI